MKRVKINLEDTDLMEINFSKQDRELIFFTMYNSKFKLNIDDRVRLENLLRRISKTIGIENYR